MPYDDLKKALERLPQTGDDTGPGFELEPCTGPLWDVVAFLETRKLGPAGRSLYNALTGYRPLTEAQEALLQKVLAHLGHPEWLEPILEELESTLQCLANCNAECSYSALNMR
jgi:hypothetical protein